MGKLTAPKKDTQSINPNGLTKKKYSNPIFKIQNFSTKTQKK
jgi:hypothetical protein